MDIDGAWQSAPGALSRHRRGAAGRGLDPTVRFGGKTLWEHGRLLLADDPAFRARIAPWGDPGRLLQTNPNIGL